MCWHYLDHLPEVQRAKGFVEGFCEVDWSRFENSLRAKFIRVGLHWSRSERITNCWTERLIK